MGKGFSTSYVPVFLAGALLGYMVKPAPQAHHPFENAALKSLPKEKEVPRPQSDELLYEYQAPVIESTLSTAAGEANKKRDEPGLQTSTEQLELRNNHADKRMQDADDQEIARLKAMEAKQKMHLAEQHLAGIQQRYGADPVTALRKQFEGEDIGGAWSYRQEAYIHDAFLNAPTLSDSALVNAECKKTQCRISLLARSDRESFAEFDALYRSVQDSGEWDGYYVVTDPATGLTSVYLQRK